MDTAHQLVEDKGIRQRPEEGHRRWFTSRYFDLIVWYDAPAGPLKGFQLTMSRHHQEREFTWTTEFRSSHKVSEARAEAGSNAQTAILYGDAGAIPEADLERFRNESAELEPELRDLVLARLAEYNASRGVINKN